MQIGAQFSERFRALGEWGSWLAQEFESLIAALQQWSAVEHNDDGTHGAITAPSVTTTSPEDPTKINTQDYVATKNLRLMPLTAAETSLFAFQQGWLYNSASLGIVVIGRTGTNYDLGLYRPTGALVMAVPTGTPDVFFAGTITERSRTAPMGEWISFTPTRGAATGTWTGGTATGYYMLIGKTLWIFFQVEASQNSNITANLTITIPGSFVAARAARYPTIIYETLGYNLDGTATTTAAGTALSFSRMSGATIAANGAGSLFVNGVIPIEVQ